MKYTNEIINDINTYLLTESLISLFDSFKHLTEQYENHKNKIFVNISENDIKDKEK